VDGWIVSHSHRRYRCLYLSLCRLIDVLMALMMIGNASLAIIPGYVYLEKNRIELCTILYYITYPVGLVLSGFKTYLLDYITYILPLN
jgi:hypothetical protein